MDAAPLRRATTTATANAVVPDVLSPSAGTTLGRGGGDAATACPARATCGGGRQDQVYRGRTDASRGDQDCSLQASGHLPPTIPGQGSRRGGRRRLAIGGAVGWSADSPKTAEQQSGGGCDPPREL